MSTLTTTVPPIPYNAPFLGEDGLITPIWSKWFATIYIRTGQAVAYPNNLLLVNPMQNLGDTLYEGASSIITSLPGNNTTTKKFLTQTGTGTSSAAPAWNPLVSTDLPAPTTIPTASTIAGWDANKNLSANSFISAYATNITAASTTVLTVGSAELQYFTGSTTQICALPAANTLALGQQFWIANNSSGAVTVNANGGGLVQTMAGSTHAIFTVTNTSSSAGVWDVNYFSGSGAGSSTPTANTISKWDANVNMSAKNFIEGYTSTATAAGTTALLVGSTYFQFFTGSTTQTVTMPVASTLTLGMSWLIVNLSSGVVTVQTSAGTTIQAMAANTTLALTCILTSGTTTASWQWGYLGAQGTALPAAAGTLTGATLAAGVTASSLTSVGAIATGTWNGTTITTAHGGTGVTSVTTAPAASSFAGWDANKNLSANSLLSAYTTTATAAGTTTLVVGSTELQYFTGITTQTCVLPAANTLTLGQQFWITNNSTGVVTVNANGGGLLQAMAATTHAIFTVTNVGSGAGTWDVLYLTASTGSLPSQSEVWVTGGSTYGSTNTGIFIFGTVQTNVGSDITYSTSATLGDKFVINTTGRYTITFAAAGSSQSASQGITRNAATLNVSPSSLGFPTALAIMYPQVSALPNYCTWTGTLTATDIIRAQGDATNTLTAAVQSFHITRIG